MNIASEADLYGGLAGVPLIIALAMQREQHLQGNPVTPQPFIQDIKSTIYQGGFYWAATDKSYEWWSEVLDQRNYKFFFENV